MVSSWDETEPRKRPRGDGLAIRFGGSMTGVGIAAGTLHAFGSGGAPTAYLSVVILLVGVALMAAGYLGWRRPVGGSPRQASDRRSGY